MQFNQRNLMIGAAAVAIAAVGGVAGSMLFAPKQSHVGETPETHAAELPAAGGAEQAGEGEHAGEEHVEGLVEMNADALKAARIGLETTVAGSLTSEISAQATVAAAPDGEAVLTARASGAITQIRKRIGDPVSQGETVAVVASSEAAGISAALATAKSRLDLAQSSFDREKRLFDEKITARQDLEAAEAELGQAKAEYTRSQAAAKAARVSADGASVFIASPIGGRITFVADTAKLGAYVSPDAVLFRIADPKRIQIQAAVPVTEARRIAPGDLATVESTAGEKLAAVVRSVTPGVDAESRSATVVISLTAGLDGLQPGQFVRAHIKPKSSAPVEGRFVLPEEAVQNVEGRDVVFVRDGDTFLATPVRVGSRGGGRIEIIDGLTAGQSVAGKNAFLLKAELGKGEAEH